MGNDSRIMQLALAIAQKTSQLDAYFTANELPTPSLDVPAVESLQLPKDDDSLYNARVDTIDACEDLAAPLKGPRELLAVKVRPPPIHHMIYICSQSLSRQQTQACGQSCTSNLKRHLRWVKNRLSRL